MSTFSAHCDNSKNKTQNVKTPQILWMFLSHFRLHANNLCAYGCTWMFLTVNVSAWWRTEDMQPHRELPQSARPAEWNAVVMFSLRGEKEGEWGERKEGKDERMTGLGFCGKTDREESEESLKEGRDGSRRSDGEREGRKDERSERDGAQERSRLVLSVSRLSLTPEPPLTGSWLPLWRRRYHWGGWPLTSHLLIANTAPPSQPPPYSLPRLDFFSALSYPVLRQQFGNPDLQERCVADSSVTVRQHHTFVSIVQFDSVHPVKYLTKIDMLHFFFWMMKS